MLSRKLLKYSIKYHQCSVRSYARKCLTSQEIRQHFLDYFVNENDHKFIRSSPIVPYCDPSVVFVNAGMNQFKNVFLGNTERPCDKAANSQKCVRVGGKHNDLSIVGTDGYHHTFFEMLGNWSFGSYFKKEACEYAWNLLTGPYNIDKNRLYVTYFDGDHTLNLPADIECKEIWLNLGVPSNRILPFGLRDNFWEMGETGPCGPCTEIHIDHLPPSSSNEMDRIKYVNAGHENLTELWNLVFIEYNRNLNGTISLLPRKHIDTGMGIERLVRLLQKKSSNYETDLFMPIFKEIEKFTKTKTYRDIYDTNDSMFELVTAYRILADHSRMITTCIADGMFPDQNHKLRRVLRKSLKICNRTFNSDHKLLQTIVPVIVNILGDTYPELIKNSSQVCQVIAHEADIFNKLMSNVSSEVKQILQSDQTIDELDVISFPGFIQAYKELNKQKLSPNTCMPGEIMFKLYDTYGLPMEIIEKLAGANNLQLDNNAFNEHMEITRKRTKNIITSNDDAKDAIKVKLSVIPPTDDSHKYLYKFNTKTLEYDIPMINDAKILHIENANDNNNSFAIILNKTCFYNESGGQESDLGQMFTSDGAIIFNVNNVTKQNDMTIHYGQFVDAHRKFSIGDIINLRIDNKRRTGNILNHTGTHLLNASVKNTTNSVTYQKSSLVTHQQLKLELGILSDTSAKLDLKHIELIEQQLRKICKENCSITVQTVDGYGLYAANDITLIPGEIYPDKNLRIITIASSTLKSCEPCCGTHAQNTTELLDICITNVKSSGRSNYLFTMVTGKTAIDCQQNGLTILNDVEQLKTDFYASKERNDKFSDILQQFRNRLERNETEMPYVIRVKCLNIVNDIDRKMKDAFREALRNFMITEMETVLQQCPIETNPYIVHFLTSGRLIIDAPLQKVTNLCLDRPIMVLSISDTTIRARCCVPANFVSDDFNARKWLADVSTVFRGANCTTPSGYNSNEMCIMKSKRIQISAFEEQLEIALKRADDYARKYFDVPVIEKPSSSSLSSSS